MNLSATMAGNLLYRAMNIACGFLITLLLTRLMTTSGFGILSLLVANITLFNLFSCLGAESGVTFHTASGSLDPGKILGILYRVIIFQLVLLLVIEVIFHKITGHYWLVNGRSFEFLLLGIAYLLGITIADKYTALLNGYHRYTLANKIVFYGNIITLLLFGIYYFTMPVKDTLFYLSLFIAATGVQAILMMMAYHLIFKKKLSFSKVNFPDLRKFFTYSFIVFFTNCIQFLAYRVDFWLVSYYRGDEALGQYALAIKLNQLGWVMPLLAASIIFPLSASGEKMYNETRLLSLMRVINTILLLFSAGAFLMAKLVIPYFFGEQYRSSILPFQYLLPGFFMFGITIMMAAWYAGRNRLKVNLTGSAICFILVFLLDLWLIPRNGIRGAAIASSIAYSGSAIFYLVYFYKSGKGSLAAIFLMKKEDWKMVKTFFIKTVNNKS